KIEADQMKIVPRPLDLNKLFAELEAIFHSSALNCNLYLKFVLPEDFPVIIVDELRLRQILLNLIGNALKFTHHGGVTIEAVYANATFTVKVQDTGFGFSPEFQQEIFQPFVQQDAIRDAQNKHGSGLGLAICYKLAKKMGGDLNVSSQLGNGSCFTLILHNIIKAPGIQKRARHKTVFIDLRPENLQVLIVDDVPINLKVLQAMLKRIGITPQLAHSGKEALQLLEQQEFNFLLTDMWMPEMNGSDLVRKIRENPRFKALQVVLLSADTTLPKEEKDIFDTVLMKPVTLKSLQEFFQEACGIE
ncbi:MAG: ATP-binding protein, partial [Victivallaceae bacterium]